MDVKEKLVDLLRNSPYLDTVKGYKGNDCTFEQGADWLIAHGVTVQEWISVKDRLPTIYDTDADNCVLAIHKASNKRYYHWRSVANNPFDFTHWMPLPQPPYRRGGQA